MCTCNDEVGGNALLLDVYLGREARNKGGSDPNKEVLVLLAATREAYGTWAMIEDVYTCCVTLCTAKEGCDKLKETCGASLPVFWSAVKV